MTKTTANMQLLLDYQLWMRKTRATPKGKAEKAYKTLCQDLIFDVPSKRMSWAVVCWAVKAMCSQLEIVHEGLSLRSLMQKCIEHNESALDALITYARVGVEVSVDIIDSSKKNKSKRNK